MSSFETNYNQYILSQQQIMLAAILKDGSSKINLIEILFRAFYKHVDLKMVLLYICY